MDLSKIWKKALGEIELEISRPNFLTWFKNSQFVSLKNGKGIIGLPNNFAKEWLKTHYHKLILKVLRNIDNSIKEIDYKVLDSTSFNKKEPPTQKEIYQKKLIDFKIDRKTNLNIKYTFKNFVVGSFNQLAFAATEAMIEDIGKKYNPLFVYGKVGLGKTHLIQAAGNEIIKKYNNKINVLYITSENFINDVIWSIKSRRMDDIKKKYRNVDVLIIDDIHFIGGKPATEEEFFHTFNTLYENNKQIIISSDRPPAAIPTLSERLRSRFEGGMIADISIPDYEARVAILKTKLSDNNWVLEDRYINYIASKIKNNVRELEGVLNKVVFYQKINQIKVDDNLIDKIINETTQKTFKNITPSLIIKEVSNFFEISPNELTGKSKKKELIEPRQITMYLLREIKKMSYSNIGRKIGNRDHTTVMYAIEKISKQLSEDNTLNQKIFLVKEKILNCR